MKPYLFNNIRTFKISGKRMLTLGVILILISIIEAEAQNPNPVIRKGNKLYRNEKFTESEIVYRKGLEVNPDSYKAGFNLSNSLIKQKKFDEALQQLQVTATQTQDPKKQAGIFHNIGNVFMEKQDYSKSVEAYKQSLRLNPSDDETRYNLAYAMSKLKDQQQNQQNQQNQKKEDKKDQNQDKQNQEKKDQQQEKQQQEQQQEQQQQQQQQQQMEKKQAEQLLNALQQDEKDIKEKVQKQQMIEARKKKVEKDW